jgi:hypothetical protein
MTGYIPRMMAEENVTGMAFSPATANLFKINEDAAKLSKDDTGKYYSTVQKLLYLGVQFSVFSYHKGQVSRC